MVSQAISPASPSQSEIPTTKASLVSVELIPPPALEKPVKRVEAVSASKSSLAPLDKRTSSSASNPRHAADYSWLIGELQYVQVRDAWRLRYLPADEEDAHGGTVTLIETPQLTGYRSGQLVRVEGQLVDPHSHEPSPTYRIQSLQAITLP